MTPITFFVPGKPATAGSKNAYPIRNKQGQPVYSKKTGRQVIAMVDACKQSKPWRKEVQAAALRALSIREYSDITQPRLGDSFSLLTGPLRVTITFQLERPAGHYRTGKNAGQLHSWAPAFPITKPDALKMARAVEDALTGIIWKDDSQIVTEFLRKRFTSLGSLTTQGCQVTIEEEAGA